MVIRGHLQGQSGHVEEFREHVVHVAVLLGGTLDKDTGRALGVAKGHRLLCLDSSGREGTREEKRGLKCIDDLGIG